jgi:S-adenosylmethionine decarboxylase
MEYSTFGRHVAVDTWGVQFDLLNDAEFLKKEMIEAAEACGATVLSVQAKQFSPQGATVLVLLSESHLSIHTYPERGFAALDCYTCGETVDPQVAIDYLVSVLKPEKTYAKKLVRGTGELQVVEPEMNLAELATPPCQGPGHGGTGPGGPPPGRSRAVWSHFG